MIFKLALHHNMGWPQRLGGGGRQLVINICFQNEMGASFLTICFLFDTIMLQLEPHNSAQSLECKLLESKHLILIIGLIFFF